MFAGHKAGKRLDSQAALSPQQTAWLTAAVAEYIRAQREKCYGRAVPLTFSELWRRFFSASDLERIRAVQAGGSSATAKSAAVDRVPNPPFYAELENLGFAGLLAAAYWFTTEARNARNFDVANRFSGRRFAL